MLSYNSVEKYPHSVDQEYTWENFPKGKFSGVGMLSYNSVEKYPHSVVGFADFEKILSFLKKTMEKVRKM